MKAFRVLFISSLLAGLVGCSSLQSCNAPLTPNDSNRSGPVCQLQPGHEPKALQGGISGVGF